MTKFEIISIFISSLIVVCTAITAIISIRHNKSTRPIITKYEKLFNGKFQITVENNRAYTVIVEKIFYQIKNRIYWSKKKPIHDILNLSEKYITGIEFIRTHTIIKIEKQAIISLTIPEYAKEKVYRLVLNTSVGYVKSKIPKFHLISESDNQVG